MKQRTLLATWSLPISNELIGIFRMSEIFLGFFGLWIGFNGVFLGLWKFGRYEYEEIAAPWTTNGELPGEEHNVVGCNPTTVAETTAMIGAAEYFTPGTVLFNETLTFRIARPVFRNATGIETLEVSGIKLAQPQLQCHWRAYLYYPTADAATTVACPEFVGLFNYVPHTGMAIFEGRNRRWRVALNSKLVALRKESFTDIVVTIAQFGPTIQPVTFKKIHIYYDTT